MLDEAIENTQTQEVYILLIHLTCSITRESKICDECLKLVEYWIIEVENRETEWDLDGRHNKVQLKEIRSDQVT